MFHKRSILAGILGALVLVTGCGAADSGTTPTVSATAPAPGSTTPATVGETAASSGAGASSGVGNSGATGGAAGTPVADTPSSGSGGNASGVTGSAGSGSSGSGAAPAPDTATGLGPAAGNGLCLDPSSPAVWSILAGVDDGIGNVGWAIREASTDPIDACPDLSYLQVDVQYATAGSPTQILFFHHGTYLGTGTAAATSYTSVIDVTPDAVTARYRWIVGDEPFSSPQGGPSTVTYRWNGSGVTAEGQFPPYL